MKTTLATALLFLTIAVNGSPQYKKTFGSIVMTNEHPAHRSIRLISYNCDFAWIAQDFGGNTPAGVFVHSKALDGWLQILTVSTSGAKFYSK